MFEAWNQIWEEKIEYKYELMFLTAVLSQEDHWLPFIKSSCAVLRSLNQDSSKKRETKEINPSFFLKWLWLKTKLGRPDQSNTLSHCTVLAPVLPGCSGCMVRVQAVIPQRDPQRTEAPWKKVPYFQSVHPEMHMSSNWELSSPRVRNTCTEYLCICVAQGQIVSALVQKVSARKSGHAIGTWGQVSGIDVPVTECQMPHSCLHHKQTAPNSLLI